MTAAADWSPARPRRDGMLSALSDDFVGYWCVALVLVLSPPVLLTAGAPALLLPAVCTLLIRALFPRVALVLVVASSIFQNLAIAAWVTNTTAVAQISTARALSFAVVLAYFCYSATRSSVCGDPACAKTRDYRWLCYAAMLLILAQTAVGAAVAGPAGAATYARNMMIVPIGVILGLEYANTRQLARFMTWAFVALLCFGYAELIFRDSLYTATGLDEFLLRTSERASEIQFRYFLGFSQWLEAQQTLLFNDPNFMESGIRTVRLQGPTAHPISFGYALVLTSLPLLSRFPLTTLLIQLPVQYGVNSKGAFFLLLACTLARINGSALLRLSAAARGGILAAGWGAFIAIAIFLGLKHGDFHVLGFLGGLHAFVAAPWGHGVGTAGNLTDAGINGRIDWSAVQYAGATDRGIESAIGVLVDQLGVLSLAYFLLWQRMISELLQERTAFGLVLTAAGIGLLANGVMQEEALFSPSAAALLCLLAGSVLAERRA